MRFLECFKTLYIDIYLLKTYFKVLALVIPRKKYGARI